MKRSTLFVILTLILSLQAFAYKQQSINITVNGKSRNMVVYVPNSLPAKSPLFIITHGMNQDPEYQYGSDKMYNLIDTAKFVVTYLRSDGNTWDIGGTNDQNFVSKTIDEMVERYDIDTDRVYWSGFSMGSMLIHHCIGNMQNKIAAFAPTSGILQNQTPWTGCNKPVNLLEVIAYGDDVFGYEQYNIHGYIENYAKHDKHTKYTKQTGYRPRSGCWFDGDLEKWTGGTNGGEVWLYSYNNGGHWPNDQNPHLLWNFCKRFSLNQPLARITEPSGDVTHLCIAPTGQASFPDITIKATGKAATGSQVVKVEFYDGKTLIDSLTEVPYNVTLPTPKNGKHNFRVVVTDNKGKTGEATCQVNNTATTTSYNLIQTFKIEGVVPQNWYVSNGTKKTVGGGMASTSGNRILRFTNATKAFEYGLLIQNAVNKEKAAWAKFGDPTGRSQMTLHAGRYTLRYKLCNWNRSDFSPVTVAIETLAGEEVASQVYTPNVNIGGKVDKKFTGVTQQTFQFDIPETGDYVLVFYTDAAKNSDFVLGPATIQATSFVATGINEIKNEESGKWNEEGGKWHEDTVYDLSGRRISNLNSQNSNLKPGLYIINGKKVVMKK